MAGVHEADAHSIDSLVAGRGGKMQFYNGIRALYADNGIEYAVDDVSGDLLDPTMVHEGRAFEMKFFDGMKSMIGCRGRNSSRQVERSSAPNGST